jgi:hypothetical protein
VRSLVKCLYLALTSFHRIGHLMMIEFLAIMVAHTTSMGCGRGSWKLPGGVTVKALR